MTEDPHPGHRHPRHLADLRTGYQRGRGRHQPQITRSWNPTPNKPVCPPPPTRPPQSPSAPARRASQAGRARSEEHTSELQSRRDLVCRLLLEKKKNKEKQYISYKKKNKERDK